MTARDGRRRHIGMQKSLEVAACFASANPQTYLSVPRGSAANGIDERDSIRQIESLLGRLHRGNVALNRRARTRRALDANLNPGPRVSDDRFGNLANAQVSFRSNIEGARGISTK